jgi:hypothetical protein
MRSALAEGAHVEDGVLVAPKCPAACPPPSLQAEPRSCRLRLEVGAVDPHAVEDHRLGIFRALESGLVRQALHDQLAQFAEQLVTRLG